VEFGVEGKHRVSSAILCALTPNGYNDCCYYCYYIYYVQEYLWNMMLINESVFKNGLMHKNDLIKGYSAAD